jgi:hypothetical protein
MKFNHIEKLEKFNRDLKKLLKRFPSLEEDLESLIKAQLIAYHKHGLDNHGIVPIDGISIQNPKIFKVLKFACKALKGKGVHSGIRITYAYFPTEDRIEFIEIYFKGDQENEDKERIKQLYQIRK